MKTNGSIRLKAGLLLLIFGLNTVVGFACAMGMNMGFNTSHHDDEATEVHVHADGKEHHHEKPTHDHEKKHKEEKGGCCNDSVIKFSQADKSVPQSNSIVNPVFFTAFIATYFDIDITYHSQVSGSPKYFVRSYHPPIPDIRIAIQSFQI